MYKLYSIMLLPAVKAMNGNRGRMIVQGGHGFVHALWDAEKRFPDTYAAYRQQTAFKAALAAADEQTIRDLHFKYSQICGVSLVNESGSKMDGAVSDAGALGLTCLGLGPIHVDQTGDDLKALKSFL